VTGHKLIIDKISFIILLAQPDVHLLLFFPDE
jgi:hypothetical protein